MKIGRIIYQDLFQSYAIKDLSYRQRLLWIGLIVHADDDGFLKGDAEYLKSKIFPYDTIKKIEVAEDLMVLSEKRRNLIESFTSENNPYIRIHNFKNLQPVKASKKKTSKIGELYNRDVLKQATDTEGDLFKVLPNGGKTYRQFENEVMREWQALVSECPSIPNIIRISDERRSRLKVRFENEHFRFNYKEAIARISNSTFLKGQNNRGWKVDFDFLIRNDVNYLKILEGKYDDRDANRKGIQKFMKKDFRDER